jgi:hypothetical protein
MRLNRVFIAQKRLNNKGEEEDLIRGRGESSKEGSRHPREGEDPALKKWIPGVLTPL